MCTLMSVMDGQSQQHKASGTPHCVRWYKMQGFEAQYDPVDVWSEVVFQGNHTRHTGCKSGSENRQIVGVEIEGLCLA